MNILFVDTTTADLVVAVVQQNNIVAVVCKDNQRRHSELLCGKVQEALECAHVGFSDLDAYACAIGPGSFTGIRIGVATVKGYATAVPRPYIAVNCLEALANSAKCGSKGKAVVDAGNGYYFADLGLGIAPCLISYDDTRAQDAARGTACDYLDGAVTIVRRHFDGGVFDDGLTPLYIRRSQAEENK